MITQITDGVRISLKTSYLPEHSSPKQSHFVFAYRITIENCSQNTVQLLRRHWIISDSNGVIKEVEGEGVVGLQPVLEPGDIHEYSSGCNLKTEIGKMEGSYLMERIFDGKKMQVSIPEFNLIVPYKLN